MESSISRAIRRFLLGFLAAFDDEGRLDTNKLKNAAHTLIADLKKIDEASG
jgi:hypothetical protein